MKIENYGVGERCCEAMRLLTEWASDKEEAGSILRVILLPIPTTRDGIHVNGCERLIADVVREVGVGDLVVGYSIPRVDTE